MQLEELVSVESNTQRTPFDEKITLQKLKHFLPAQAALKDFIHQNTLHFFQHLRFHQGLQSASEILGYRVYLPLEDYRTLFHNQIIREDTLERIIGERFGAGNVREWKSKALFKVYKNPPPPRIGMLRANWKKNYLVDLDSLVHPLLFRMLCSYLDQGISIWGFPVSPAGFLTSIAAIERNTFVSFFKSPRSRKLLLEGSWDVEFLLKMLVGDPTLYEQYLFDMQFAHQGWSGMVSVIEDQPQTLLDQRKISLKELIVCELLLEIDALDFHFGENWEPLAERLSEKPPSLLDEVPKTELSEVLSLWQDAFEWSYYDQVLNGLLQNVTLASKESKEKSFQAMFCIDDREAALQMYLEQMDPGCGIFSTPGFFNVEFYFQPEHGKFYMKQCPAPVTPKYLIKEIGSRAQLEKDPSFSKHSHSLFRGWLITQTLGVWTALKLFLSIFRPSMSPATASSFKHMDKVSSLTILNKSPNDIENNLQIGFTLEEMALRATALLKSIGLTRDFAPIVYVIGHGSSSVNNPHYAAYDCGACSGRAGSVNSRVMSFMLNNSEVRLRLKQSGIIIPPETQFVGGLHDTTRDEIVFFDESALSNVNSELHKAHLSVFNSALDLNAKERSRRFESINTKLPPAAIHDNVKIRSVSLFEPRPELNHATNTLCIVGKRSMTRGLFLDRRAFLNSYDYSQDLDGTLLLNIMKPLGPVCGGINLEYFFSRVDNQKLGAGTKLPHNVMGLFAVANGSDGDLRPGLPSQMIEVHDPIRLLLIVQHFPQVVLDTIKKSADIYEWYINEWVRLVCIDPETSQLYLFQEGRFVPYEPKHQDIGRTRNIGHFIENHSDNIPVQILS